MTGQPLSRHHAGREVDVSEAERRPVAAKTIEEAARNMATLAPELADPRLMGSDEEFAAVLPRVAETVQRMKDGEFHSLDLVLGTSYRSSPIVSAGDGSPAGTPHGSGDQVAAGDRLPHAWLSPTCSLYDLLGPEYSLVGAIDVAAGWRLVDAAAELGIPLTPVELSSQESLRLFGSPVVLVRPDQHIAWLGTDPGDPKGLLLQITGASLVTATSTRGAGSAASGRIS